MPKVPLYPKPKRTIPKLEPSKAQATRTTPTYAEATGPKDGLVFTLPHPFKCSKCDYVALSAIDSKKHWLGEH